MIHEIEFKNYKPFENGKVSIKPITILLGANNAGKTSISELIMILQETAKSKEHKSVLKIQNKYVNIANNSNLFYNKETSKNIILSFLYENKKATTDIKKSIRENLKNNLSELCTQINNIHKTIQEHIQITQPLLFPVLKIQNEKDRATIKEQILPLPLLKYSKKIKPSVFISECKERSDYLRKILDRHGAKKLSYLFNKVEKSFDDICSEDLDKSYHFINAFNKLQIKNIRILFEIQKISEDKLKLSKISLESSQKTIIKFSFNYNSNNDNYNPKSIYSDFIDIDTKLNTAYIKRARKAIDPQSTLFYLFDSNIIFNYDQPNKVSFIDTTFEIISYFNILLCEDIKKYQIDYIGPFRSSPKQYYFLDRSNIEHMLKPEKENSLITILKDKPQVLEKTNSWLEQFNISIEVEQIHDIIYRLKVNHFYLDLDITDVGYGLSQILPIVVQGILSPNNSLLIIDQPEIHLHPKLQANLADLFIDIISSSSKKIIIETHSEYLLKRLRRRLSEKKLPNKDVAIHHISPRDNQNPAKIERKEIGVNGAFDWPKDFYGGELLKDTVEFLKNQDF